MHAGGVLLLSCAIYNSSNTVIANKRPLSGAVVDNLHIGRNIQVKWCSPSVLQDVARNTTQVEIIVKLDDVSHAGGFLHAHMGNTINARTHLFSTVSSTKTGSTC